MKKEERKKVEKKSPPDEPNPQYGNIRSGIHTGKRGEADKNKTPKDIDEKK